MATWTGTFTDEDWHLVSVLNMFETALWEREWACTPLYGGGLVGADIEPAVLSTAGRDVQAAAFWRTMQEKAEWLVGNATSVGGGWMRPGFDPAGKQSWDSVSGLLRQIATHDPVFPDHLAVFEELGILSWMRKRPRQITSTTAAFDDQGNPAVSGQRALLLGVAGGDYAVSDAVYRWSGSAWVSVGVHGVVAGPDIVYTDRPHFRQIEAANTYPFDVDGNAAVTGHRALIRSTLATSGSVGGVYEHDGSTWVLSTTGAGPDTLTGEDGVERTIADHADSITDLQGRPITEDMVARSEADNAVYIYKWDESLPDFQWKPIDDYNPGQLPDRVTSGTGGGVLKGYILAGDYIGGWILNELRDFIRALGSRTLYSVSQFGSSVYGEVNFYAEGVDKDVPPYWNLTRQEAIDRIIYVLGVGPTHRAVDIVRGADQIYTTMFQDPFPQPEGPQYVASVGLRASTYDAGSNAHRSRTFEFFVGFNNALVHIDPDAEFYPHGNTVPTDPNTYGAFATTTVAAGTALTPGFKAITNVKSNFPFDFPPVPEPGEQAVWGFYNSNPFAVVTWAFTYG